ncbi:MAG: hypothetical protein V3W04_06650 [Gammaproteobacteria bacterium]
MRKTIYITPKDTEKLKQKARKLKRAENLSHHEALDSVAKSAGFSHWQHVCQSTRLLNPTCIFTMEIKEAEGFDRHFIPDASLSIVCEDDLYKQFVLESDELDIKGRPLKETHPRKELCEIFQDIMDGLVFYRASDKLKITSIEQLFKLVHEQSFWLPNHAWINGKYFDGMA